MKAHPPRFLFQCLLVVLAILTAPVARAALYQWSAAVGGENRRVYLWIPEDCKRLRGLILAMKNLSEPGIIESPAVREVCRQQRVGILWVSEDRAANGFAKTAFNSGWGWPSVLTPDQRKEYDRVEKIAKEIGSNPTPEQLKAKADYIAMRLDLDARAQKDFDEIMDTMARESGYEEIRRAPLFVVSHSMGGCLCWGLPFYMTERIWGSIPFKTGGAWASCTLEKPDATMDGVPLLYINWHDPEGSIGVPRHWTWNLDITSNKGGRNGLSGQVIDWGASHFDVSDEICNLVAMFIRKAANYRLSDEIPADGFPKLKDLRPEQGWLASSLLNTNQQFEIAPYSDYKGDKSRAFWFFDEEMAKAVVHHHFNDHTKKPQFPTIVDNGQKLEPTMKHFHEIQIPFDSGVDDGWTFKLTGDFQEKVPSEKPEEQLPAGHPSTGKVTVLMAGGPNLVKLDDETFRYREFNRGPNNHGWVVAYHPGDSEYSQAYYQGCIFFPKRLNAGHPQTLTFPEIKDVPAGVKEIELKATSNVPGQVVEYYVVSGPAEITGKDPKYTGSTLRFTPIPPSANYPVKVIVVAYQKGRLKEPLVQTAPDVVQEFHVTKP